MDRLDTVVVGGGQAGLAMGQFLAQTSRSYVVFERGRVGETWRSQRWDSFKLNTPNWMSMLPGAPGEGSSLDEFSTRDEWVTSLETYAERFQIPVRTGVEVESVRPEEHGGFVVAGRDQDGRPVAMSTRSVVVASGMINVPKVPALGSELQGVLQLHTGDYRSADTLPPGAVVVVGGGQSGCQIAEDLLSASRRVYLCASRVARAPRRYRGRDITSWWLDMGVWDVAVETLEDPAITLAPQPQVSGVGRYGHTVSYQKLADAGVTLMGRLIGVDEGVLVTGNTLAEQIGFADERSRQFKADIDEYISEARIDAPPPDADPADTPVDGPMPSGLQRLDLRDAGVGALIWCTGFTGRFDWLEMPVLDGAGAPLHRRGIGPVPGVYFLGLPWLHTRKSGLILGMEEDARFIAERLDEFLG